MRSQLYMSLASRDYLDLDREHRRPCGPFAVPQIVSGSEVTHAVCHWGLLYACWDSDTVAWTKLNFCLRSTCARGDLELRLDMLRGKQGEYSRAEACQCTRPEPGSCSSPVMHKSAAQQRGQTRVKSIRALEKDVLKIEQV